MFPIEDLGCVSCDLERRDISLGRTRLYNGAMHNHILRTDALLPRIHSRSSLRAILLLFLRKPCIGQALMQPKKVSYSNGPEMSDFSGYSAGKREFRITSSGLDREHCITVTVYAY